MSTLFITRDPIEYLTPGKEGAAKRVTFKHATRERASLERFDAIAIVDHGGRLIEQVNTAADIADKRYVVGYRVQVKPTAPDLRCDHVQNLVWAEVHGDVVESSDKHLTIHVPHPRELDTLKCDYRFRIIEINVVYA
jgi:hypothetical protein